VSTTGGIDLIVISY